MKKSWKLHQPVRFVRCGSLSGLTGKLVGMVAEHVDMCVYSVQLEEGVKYYGWTVVSITEHCLEAI